MTGEIPYRAAGTFAGPSYVEREADRLLLEAIEQNQRYPYVLAPRQSGKSSLLFRARSTLDSTTYRTAFVDLSTFDIGDYDTLWRSILEEIAVSARLDATAINPRRPEDTFIAWLKAIRERLVIFVDEVDTLVGTTSCEHLFSKLRSLFNKRAGEPAFGRLLIVLSGAAHPTQLIKDHMRSPFNVGIEIKVDDLTPARAKELVSHLGSSGAQVAAGVAERLHAVTGGSVYLGQLVLERLWVTGRRGGAIVVADLDAAVDAIIAGAPSEVHFRNIFEVVFHNQRLVSALNDLRSGRSIDLHAVQDLRLSGLSDGATPYRNEVYRRVFDEGGPLDLISVARNAGAAKMVDEIEVLLNEHEAEDQNAPSYVARIKRIDELARLLMARPRPRGGARVAGAELIKPIGSGSFGTIWLSRSLATGQIIATKIFHVDKLTQGVMLWRFRRTIRAMTFLGARRDAPHHIVRIRDVAEDTLAFSMDYLSGGDLEQVAQCGWTLARKIEIILDVCRAVSFAHRNGVIHRDVKPSNVVLDAKGRPTLTDFDIADIKFVTNLSTVEGGLGTPIFAAPEQLENANRADERSDIYSLGRLLHFLLLERSPGFQVELDPSLHNLSTFPAPLVAVIRRATQLRPERRYASVEQMIADLERYQTSWARVRAWLHNARRWTRSNGLALAFMAIVVSGLAGFAMYERQIAAQHQQLTAQLVSLAETSNALSTSIDQVQSNKNALHV
jgi:hypothetical protein